MGKGKHERCFLAGNQLGKTTCGAAEDSFHLTGLYPEWWDGFRFDHPVRMWVAGPTTRKVRDVLQRKILGPRGRWGTGMVPKDTIADKPVMHPGVPGLVDTIRIKHKTGGESTLQFMSYDMDDDAWASETLHALHCDEEPPIGKWTEGLARMTATGGIAYITTTPLLGMSEVIRMFYPRPNTPDRGMVRMGIKDAAHIAPEDHERILARYPAHERTARAEGIPILGSGQVYDVPEEAIRIPAFEIPSHFAKIFGLDLGGGVHPCAFVQLAWDRDTDTVYVTDCYKSLDARISSHVSALLSRGAAQIPVAWPHDAHQEDRGTGLTYAAMYKQAGVRMLRSHAVNDDGSNYVEPAISKMQSYLGEGRLRVFEHLTEWFDEYRTYHRKQGKIVKKYDDLMDATRYALMMVASSRGQSRNKNPLPSTVGMGYDPKAPDMSNGVHYA
tara:strand:+ start:966 stop:2291 length:1326 start_codon:yes stop_codon:yes gene_type:complete